MLGLIEPLDAMLERVYAPIVSRLCRITGMSNFTVARIALAVGSLLIVAEAAIRVSERSLGILLLIFLSWWVTVGIRFFTKAIRKLQQAEEAGSDVVPLSEFEWTYLALFRSTFTLIGLAYALPPSPRLLHAAFDVVVSLAGYAATNTHKKRRSRIKRAIRFLKERKPEIRGRTPVPSPS